MLVTPVFCLTLRISDEEDAVEKQYEMQHQKSKRKKIEPEEEKDDAHKTKEERKVRIILTSFV